MAERIRLYTDEHVPKTVVKGLREERGADVLTVAEAGKLGASDEEHLEFALQEVRVIFTHDADFLRLHASGMEHAGIVYAPRRMPIGEVIYGLMLLVEALDPNEMKGHLEFL